MASPHYFGWKLQNMECCVYTIAKANILQNLTQLAATCVNKTYSAVIGKACNLYLLKCKQGSRYIKCTNWAIRKLELSSCIMIAWPSLWGSQRMSWQPLHNDLARLENGASLWTMGNKETVRVTLWWTYLVPGGMGCNRTGIFKGHSLPGWSSPYLGFVVGRT